MSLESITRKELQKIYEIDILPIKKKFERKNANSDKLEAELKNILQNNSNAIHILCLKLLGNYLNKSMDEMLTYHVIFVNKENNDYKLIDRLGNNIVKYHIDIESNHLFIDNNDLGVISLLES